MEMVCQTAIERELQGQCDKEGGLLEKSIKVMRSTPRSAEMTCMFTFIGLKFDTPKTSNVNIN